MSSDHLPMGSRVDRCCGYDTHLRGVKFETRMLSHPPPSVQWDRWIIIGEWQCHRVMEHHNRWWESTDDPEVQPPFRTVDDPAKRQSIIPLRDLLHPYRRSF